MKNLTAVILVAALAIFGQSLAAPKPQHCAIVKAGTKSCQGAKGEACSNRAYLLAQVKAKHASVSVCGSHDKAPHDRQIKLALGAPACKHCRCFLVPAKEKRTCRVLKADKKFKKHGCRDQDALKTYLAAGPKATACFIAKPKGPWNRSAHNIKAHL